MESEVERTIRVDGRLFRSGTWHDQSTCESSARRDDCGAARRGRYDRQ